MKAGTRCFGRVSSEAHPVRRGALPTGLLVGSVLWLLVFAAIGAGYYRAQDQAADSPSDNSADAASQPDVTVQGTATIADEEASSAKLSLPERTLPDFELEECLGGTISLDDLRGKRWVAAFMFTRCKTTCPMINRKVMELHQRVAESAKDVLFVTFTVDPKYDTPEVLSTYTEIFDPDRERWKFLTGQEGPIYDLILRGFLLFVKENVGEARRPGFEVAHSNRVVLVNENAQPVASFLATKEADMVELRQILEGKRPFPEPGPAANPGGLSFTRGNGEAVEVDFQLKPAEDASDSESETAAPAETDDSERSGSVPKGDSDEASETSQNQRSDSEINAEIDRAMPSWSKNLPMLNACLNTISTVLLLVGYVSIRAGKRDRHRNCMVGAFLVSVVFLASYLVHHWALGEYTGEYGRKFVGPAGLRPVYYLILVPHVILAAFVPFLAIRVFQHAFSERWDKHRRLARITFPVWMYVSVTGVAIYWMLYQLPAAPAAR